MRYNFVSYRDHCKGSIVFHLGKYPLLKGFLPGCLCQEVLEVSKGKLITVLEVAIIRGILLHCVIGQMNVVIVQVSFISRVLGAGGSQIALSMIVTD